MLEIFYLLILFNVFMAIFGMLTLSNGQPLRTPSPGDTEGGIGGLVLFTDAMAALVALVGTLYVVTALTGNTRTPMSVIYGFAVATFQIAYAAAWTTFWNPLVSFLPDYMDTISLVLFALFTFLVQSVFWIAFIQMTTGGWGLYK